MSTFSNSDSEFSMNPADLYREDTFTDRRVGTLRRLTPIRADGSDDPARQVVFVGATQMLTPLGALPLNFDIEAASLEQAARGFAAAAQQAAAETIEELKQLRREQASSIVLPDGPGGMGGLPGGGKIQF